MTVYAHGNDKLRFVYDTTTGEYGWQRKLTNKTGGASVKGTVYDQSSGTDDAVTAIAAGGPDPILVCYEAGVADGSEHWCWAIGSLCQVLLENSTAATRGYWVYVSQTAAGRADATNAAPPGGTIAALENHFEEIGHAAESQGAGTDVLCLIHFHVN